MGGAEDAGSCACMVSGQPSSTKPTTNEMSLGACIGESRSCVFEHEAEHGVVGDLAAKGVPGGKDLVAGGFTSMGGD